jgi:L-malate glycosyltransferase
MESRTEYANMYRSTQLLRPVLCITGGSYLAGAELVTLHVLEGLKQRGAEVVCICSAWNDGVFPERLDRMRVAHHALKLGWLHRAQIGWTLTSVLHWPGAFVRAQRLLSGLRNPTVYASSYRHVLLLYPLMRGRIILHVHDMLSRDRQFRALLPCIERKVTYYVAVSEFIRDDLMGCGIAADKIALVHNGTTIPPAHAAAPAAGPVGFGIVGQVVPHKGHEDLLRALALLRDQGRYGFRLTIVGRGDPGFEADLKQLVCDLQLQDFVRWRGFRSNPAEIYADLDVVVVPTRTPEPFSMVAIEAQSRGLPVIASNAGGLMESVHGGLTGLLFEPASVPSLAEALAHFVACSEESRRQMGMAGRERVKQRFSSDVMCDKLFTLLATA